MVAKRAFRTGHQRSIDDIRELIADCGGDCRAALLALCSGDGRIARVWTDTHGEPTPEKLLLWHDGWAAGCCVGHGFAAVGETMPRSPWNPEPI